MPFHLPFNFPYLYNNYRFVPPSRNIPTPKEYTHNANLEHMDSEKKDSEVSESSESLFEIFGLKLYLDDIIILCILFFLYTEKVKDDELFICLILLLLS